ncbi:flavodoxin family protein, partial [Caldisericum sp.]|uniref:flavodoxin family protein n=1 Tax=Caldisericum sp. TaxID=2499687 RepID=UPI003D0C8F52
SRCYASYVLRTYGKKVIVELENGKRSFLKDGMYAMLERHVKIEPIKSDIASYDKIFILSPVWAGNLPAAVRSFLEDYNDSLKGKDVYLVSVSGFGERNKKFQLKFRKYLGREPMDSLMLKEDDMNKNLYSEKV